MTDINTLLNDIIAAYLPQLNAAVGNDIRNAGLDPKVDVYDNSWSIGIGTAYVHVTNLTGISSVIIDNITFSNVVGDTNKASGNITLTAHLQSDVNVNAEADVTLGIFGDPGVSGYGTISGVSMVGQGTFAASLHTGTTPSQVCIDSASLSSLNASYANAFVMIPDLALLSGIADLILPALKSTFEGIMSSNVSGVLSNLLSQHLPQCVNLPFAETEAAPSRARADSHDSA